MTARHDTPSSRRTLARDAAARLVAAACREQGRLWDKGETEYETATTDREARDAVEPLVAVCASCPVPAECQRWASIDRYTGVAGGLVWHNGTPGAPKARARSATAEEPAA